MRTNVFEDPANTVIQNVPEHAHEPELERVERQVAINEMVDAIPESLTLRPRWVYRMNGMTPLTSMDDTQLDSSPEKQISDNWVVGHVGWKMTRIYLFDIPHVRQFSDKCAVGQVMCRTCDVDPL